MVRRARTIAALVATLAIVLVACGSEVADSADPSALPQPDPSGEGLGVRLVGSVVGERFCPGGRPPCLPFSGDVSPDADDTAWVVGRLTDERLEIDGQIPAVGFPDRDHTTNRCAEQGIAGPAAEAELRRMEEVLFAEESPGIAGFADWWTADDGTPHVAIAGDRSDAEAFLADAGLTDVVCLVELPRSDAELRAVANRIEEVTTSWPGERQGGATGDPWTGVVQAFVDRLDPDRRAELERIGTEADGIPVEIQATVEVIDGTLDDYDASLATIGEDLDPADGLRATCGPVVFTTVPPDLDEFPPLDDDARSALDQLVSEDGETGAEAAGFDADVDWSIAHRSDDELILFGQRPGTDPDGSGEFVDARFERRDGAWRPTGWGGCHLLVEAPGFGPAAVALNPELPPDPALPELDLLIQERNCANGQAPVGREVRTVITETPTSVEILALVEPVQGDANCPGNPWHPIVVDLDEPLGDRILLDGHAQPPTELEFASTDLEG